MIPKFRSWVENVRHPEFSFMQYAPEFNGEINQIFEKDGEIQHGVKVSYMQSTGLKDKNGVEIFEGDIVNHYWSNEVGESFCHKAVIKNPFDYKVNEAMHLIYADELEILGNIWENPELLEGE